MTLARLMLRRHRTLIASWSTLLIASAGGTVWAYQSTYPTVEQRRTATELAQDDTATLLLYGNLPRPGTSAQMFSWEIGAIATILAAVMAVLVAVALTRAGEDEGTLELVRSCGVGRRSPLYSAFTLLTTLGASLVFGCAVGVGLNTGRVEAVTWSGSVAFGAVVGLTFLLTSLFTVVLAQIVTTARGARVLGFTAVGAAFIIRAVADTQHIDWLNRLSLLGLRAAVQPFTGDNWSALTGYLLAAVALAWLAVMINDRREYRAGLVHRRDLRDTHLNVRTSFGLAARLARPPILTWTVAVAAIGTLFSTMGSGVVEQSQRGDVGGFLGEQIGTADPVAGYFAYCGTVIGIVVSSFAVLSVLTSHRDETAGLTDHQLTAGIRRWAPLAGQVAVTALGAAAILVATGALAALIAPLTVTGTDVAARASGYVVGQWPATMAVTGWTALLVGRWPKHTWLAWIPLIASSTLALLGRLLGLPQNVRDLGIFQHVPDVAAASPSIRPLVVLLATAVTTTLLGIAGITRRDIITG